MIQVILDVETQKIFDEVGGYFPDRLGVSFVGVNVRHSYGEPGEFKSYFEKDLPKLFPLLEKADVIVGFNIDEFDMPTFTSYYNGEIGALPTLDIMKRIKDSIGHRVGLDAVAQETLGIGKTGDGLDAIKYFKAKDWKNLEKYCLQDVKVTRDLLDYGYSKGEVKFRNKWNRLITTPVDFTYTPRKHAGIQMSLI
ncbi:MAG TPA: ribonuclease H-like domain-containing protein [Patescibacteria group bacterium]|jgi:DEAD/DEAH box helicase domain-containing protein